jgi:hypothetical protein
LNIQLAGPFGPIDIREGIKMFIEFRDLEKISNDSSAFISLFRERIASLSSDAAVRLLQCSGVCVDVYSTGKNVALFESCLSELKVKFGVSVESKLEQLKNEVEIFNYLFKQFEEMRIAAGLDKIPKNQKLISLLLLVEKLFRKFNSSRERLLSESEAESQENFSTIYDENFERLEFGNFDQVTNLYEELVLDLSLVYKFLQYRYEEELNPIVNGSTIRDMSPHLNIVQPYKVVYELHERWKFFENRIVRKKNTLGFIDVQNAIVEQAIDSQRFLNDIRVGQAFLSSHLFGKKFEGNNPLLPPTNFQSAVELMSSIHFGNRMYASDIFSLEFHKVPIAEWVRAYTVIMNVTSALLLGNNGALFLEYTRDEFVALLTRNGIQITSVETIVAYLSFDHKKSVDFFDTPLLIASNGNILLFPVVCHCIDFAESFFSNLQSNQYDLSKRGVLFEDKILERILEQGIAANKLYKKAGNIEYECDVCFYLDGQVYLLEAKVFFEPRSVRRKYEHLKKIEDAINQLERISSYYSLHKHEVISQLKLPCDTVIANFTSILITSTMYSGNPRVGNTYVSDFNSFNRFLVRDPLGLVNINKKNENELDIKKFSFVKFRELYEGKIDNKKLVEFLANQPAIEYSKNFFKMSDIAVKVAGVELRYGLPIQVQPIASSEVDKK